MNAVDYRAMKLFDKQLEFFDKLMLVLHDINSFITTVGVWAQEEGAEAKEQLRISLQNNVCLMTLDQLHNQYAIYLPEDLSDAVNELHFYCIKLENLSKLASTAHGIELIHNLQKKIRRHLHAKGEEDTACEKAAAHPLHHVIKAIGVGGGGNNAVGSMVNSNLQGVQFLVVNTDMHALDRSPVPIKLQIGSKLTNGRGAGANPEIGRSAALEDAEKIKAALAGTEMVFITAGMGGGTGTGAAPVIAGLARKVGALAVGVVTKPFEFEGAKRMKYADEGIAELKKQVDALIVIPNSRVLNLAEKRTSVLDEFKLTDNILVQAVKGISDLVMASRISIEDVRKVLSTSRQVEIGIGINHDGNILRATVKAMRSGFLEYGAIRNARKILISIAVGSNIDDDGFEYILNVVRNRTSTAVLIRGGWVVEPSLRQEVRVTLYVVQDKPRLSNNIRH